MNTAMTTHQRHSNMNRAPKTVPKVRLYVERPGMQESWLVHIGHVADRGRWRTELHAHPAYGQVIFVRVGRGVMNLDGHSVPFEGPCALLLPTECVHGLKYEVDADRWVVTIEVTYLTQVNARLPEFSQLWALPRSMPFADTPEAAAEFHALILQLQREVQSRSVGHVAGTEALLTSLLLMLVRRTSSTSIGNGGPTPNETRLVERFRDLIEQHYRQNWQLQNYASAMAVSLVQLRAACSASTGQSPTKLIHARLITEAKRGLIFGDMSMEQIAFGLGFSDAAYFTRFFRKEVGQSPSQFRVTSRHRPDAA